MAISQTQIVDYLYKKLGYGVSKTDYPSAKSPSNETIGSPLLVAGDTIWQLSGEIPNTTAEPQSNSSAVTVYNDTLSSTVQCTVDVTTVTPNETWFTNLTDWISAEFGSGYQVQAYAAPPGTANPSINGVWMPPHGTGNNDAWFFDYQSGVINFADVNIPAPIVYGSGNVVYVTGARYTGQKGISNFPQGLNLGNLSVSGNAIFGSDVTVHSLNVATTITALGGGHMGIVGNLDITGSISSTGNISTQSDLSASGNASITGNLSAAGNVTVTNALSVGTDVSIQGNTINQGNLTLGANSVFTGNILADTITSIHGNLIFTTGTGGITTIVSDSALGLPAGTADQRPVDPAQGYLRYNTDTGSIEWWTGTEWASARSLITDQSIIPDGSSQTYVLDQTATSTGILVSINGTIQQPGVAYDVSGDQITFTETPLPTDIIDVRYLATAGLTANVDVSVSYVNGGLITMGAGTAAIDAFSTQDYRSVKYTVSSTTDWDSQLAEVLLTQNLGQVAVSTVNTVNTGANTVSFSANIQSGMVTVWATATANVNKLRIQRTYFNL
jgi:cytoskeletal protein CcmA (bactofilin family)